MQLVAEPPLDYFPIGHIVHPSVFVEAPFRTAILPAGHDMFEQLTTLPPLENLPAGQISQPSVSVRAPVFAAL